MRQSASELRKQGWQIVQVATKTSQHHRINNHYVKQLVEHLDLVSSGGSAGAGGAMRAFPTMKTNWGEYITLFAQHMARHAPGVPLFFFVGGLAQEAEKDWEEGAVGWRQLACEACRRSLAGWRAAGCPSIPPMPSASVSAALKPQRVHKQRKSTSPTGRPCSPPSPPSPPALSSGELATYLGMQEWELDSLVDEVFEAQASAAAAAPAASAPPQRAEWFTLTELEHAIDEVY